MPAVSSVTGCSTCSRVLTSRNEMVPSGADQVLDRAGPVVAGLAADRLGRLVDLAALLVGEERRGRLLDQLLVPALQRAVAGADHDHVAVLVGEDLGLDVARAGRGSARRSTRRGRTRRPPRGWPTRTAPGSPRCVRATLSPRPPPPKAALIATGRPCSWANATISSGVRDRFGRAGDERRAGPLGDVPGGDLVAEVADRLRGRPDPGQPGVDDGLGEVGVLGEEAVAGVHRVGAGPAPRRR